MQTVPNPTENATEKTKGKAVQELRARIDESVDALAKAVDTVRASEQFKRYLDVQAKFHRYSWGNTLLIAAQRPDATSVAGYRTWQKLGRQVRKGERGIRICAPCPYKREVDRGNGQTEEVAGMFFRCVSVFDVGQTDGEELPTVDVPTVEEAADSLLANLQTVTRDRGIVLEMGPIDCGAFGTSKRGTVQVDNQYSSGQQAKTLAHELAHEAMHWEDRGPVTRSIAELEAEAVSYVVCKHANLDVEVRASRYIALWEGDSKNLKESLGRIADTARALIDDLDKAAGRKAVA